MIVKQKSLWPYYSFSKKHTNAVAKQNILNSKHVGMQYRSPSMAQNAWYTYWFEKNLQS